jgi:flagellar basal body-associated protein FliL
MTAGHTARERQAGEPGGRSTRLLTIVRYVVPALVVVAGIVVMSLGSEAEVEGGAGIVGAGLAIYAMNWLYRASVSGDRERDAEEAAREYLDRNGHWPDEHDQRSGAGSPPQR